MIRVILGLEATLATPLFAWCTSDQTTLQSREKWCHGHTWSLFPNRLEVVDPIRTGSDRMHVNVGVVLLRGLGTSVGSTCTGGCTEVGAQHTRGLGEASHPAPARGTTACRADRARTKCAPDKAHQHRNGDRRERGYRHGNGLGASAAHRDGHAHQHALLRRQRRYHHSQARCPPRSPTSGTPLRRRPPQRPTGWEPAPAR